MFFRNTRINHNVAKYTRIEKQLEDPNTSQYAFTGLRQDLALVRNRLSRLGVDENGLKQKPISSGKSHPGLATAGAIVGGIAVLAITWYLQRQPPMSEPIMEAAKPTGGQKETDIAGKYEQLKSSPQYLETQIKLQSSKGSYDYLTLAAYMKVKGLHTVLRDKADQHFKANGLKLPHDGEFTNARNIALYGTAAYYSN